MQNCRALDHVRDAHCDWRQLRRRRAGGERDFEQTVGLRLTEGNHRGDALPAAPPWSMIPLRGQLLDINRHACESPSCRARTSRSREVACDGGEPRQVQKGPAASDVLTVWLRDTRDIQLSISMLYSLTRYEVCDWRSQ